MNSLNDFALRLHIQLGPSPRVPTHERHPIGHFTKKTRSLVKNVKKLTANQTSQTGHMVFFTTKKTLICANTMKKVTHARLGSYRLN